MSKLLAYDDVNIVPKYSELFSRKRVILNTKLTKTLNIKIPIVSSPMDTVTELDMAKEMMALGGVGVIHRFMSIKEQSDIVKKIKLNKKLWGQFISENVTLANEVDSTFAYRGKNIIGDKTISLERYTEEDWKFVLKEILDNHPITLHLSATRSYYRKIFKLKFGHNVDLDYFDVHKRQIDPNSIKVSKQKLKLIKDFYKSMKSLQENISKLSTLFIASIISINLPGNTNILASLCSLINFATSEL